MCGCLGNHVTDPIPTERDDTLFALKDEREALHVYQPVALAEPPEWSPFLPVPGVYEHPVFGEMDLRPETYERMIANFKSGVYQEQLPVNTEHDPLAAGAIGWITDMRLADTGALEAKVNWTKRGRELIEDDRYRYVSAEFFNNWSDPVNPDTVHQNVAVGMALTTKPYFKERVLPPLVASEAVLTRLSGKEADVAEEKPVVDQTPDAPAPQPIPDDTPEKETPPVTEPTPTPVADEPTADEPAAQLSDSMLAAQMNEAMLSEYRALKAREIQLNADVARLSEENAKLARDGRVKKFTDEVRGRSDANGLPWVGDIEAHVAMLVDLSEKFGESSAQVVQYINTNRAHAELIKTSQLFSELGTGRTAESMTGQDRAELAARQLRDANPALTKEQALAQAYREHPEFYQS